MSSSQSSFKRLAWIVTLLGVALFAGAFIYFAAFSTQPDQFSSYRQQSNQRHERAVDAVQSGMVEIVGAGVAVIGIILLVIAYATAPKNSTQLTADPTVPADQGERA